MPLAVVLGPFCPRKLRPEGPNAKRYMAHPLALYGYMLACPTCGFIEMHTHEAAGFVELDGQLEATSSPVRCMLCMRSITIRDRIVSAATATSSASDS